MTLGTKDVYRVLGASNHTRDERAKDDFYATNPKAIDLLLGVETFNHRVLEPACGMGHLSKRLEEFGHKVFSYDLVDRGYGKAPYDFLERTKPFNGDIITNPPYNLALEFIQKSLELIPPGNKAAFYLKIQFLEGKERRAFFEKSPPKTIYVLSGRLGCGKDGVFSSTRGAIAYSWWVWEKGYSGDPHIKWIN